MKFQHWKAFGVSLKYSVTENSYGATPTLIDHIALIIL